MDDYAGNDQFDAQEKAVLRFAEQLTRNARVDADTVTSQLVGYRNAAIELWTHAIGGLSENDFITAAKINQLPVDLKGR